MFRKKSYTAIRVPSISQIILVCDEQGNKTYIVHTAQDFGKYMLMPKSELDELVRQGIVSSLTWRKPDEWKGRIAEILQKKPCKPETTQSLQESNYYTRENVLYDLRAFAIKAGIDCIADMKMDNIKSTEITCRNGKTLKGQAYCANAALALGFSETYREASSFDRVVLVKLFMIAGIKAIGNSDYYDLNNVRHDLYAFAHQLGPGKTPLDLDTSNMKGLKITCSSGQTISHDGYLLRAARALGIEESEQKKTLVELLRIAGFELIGHPDYYHPTNIRRDLQAFAKELGPDKTIDDLTLSKDNNVQQRYKN